MPGPFSPPGTAQDVNVTFDPSDIVNVRVRNGNNTAYIEPATEGGNLATIKTNTDKIPSLGQAVKAGSVPVTIASDQGTLDTNLKQINGTTISVNTGATGNGSPRVTVAVDSATIAGSASLPAGTNNIGDVDVLTVPAPLSTTGGGTEATALRVTLANNTTGVLAVTDNGGSLTVDDGGSSLTVDTTQLPTTLGTKTAANSISVTTASDEVVPYGQATMAASKPVVIASDQSAITVSASAKTVGNATFTSASLAQDALSATFTFTAGMIQQKLGIRPSAATVADVEFSSDSGTTWFRGQAVVFLSVDSDLSFIVDAPAGATSFRIHNASAGRGGVASIVFTCQEISAK